MRGAAQIVTINSGLLDKYINLKLTPISVHVQLRYIMHEPTILDRILSQTFFSAVSHALPLLFNHSVITNQELASSIKFIEQSLNCYCNLDQQLYLVDYISLVLITLEQC